jgi:hypothetical protein
MEAAVQRIVIFRLALGTHLEIAHRGLSAVIGHAFNYGKAWTAIGAVGEGITVAAIFRIQQLIKASLAGSDIWRNELVFPSLSLALPNLEVLVTDRAMILDSYVFDVSQRWGFCPEFLLKLLNSLCFSFHLNPDIFRSVVNPALKIMFNSQSIDERPEANALNNAPDANRSCFERPLCCFWHILPNENRKILVSTPLNLRSEFARG